MRKKGFTLIELLAVIVILAIIALIATPIILGVIDKAREGSAKSSALGYIDAVEKQAVLNTINQNRELLTDGNYDVPELTRKGVTVKGTKSISGNLQLKKGIVTNATFCISNYLIKYKNNEATINGKCNSETIVDSSLIPNPTFNIEPKSGWSVSKTVEITYPDGFDKEYSLDGGTTWKEYKNPIILTDLGSTSATVIARAGNGVNYGSSESYVVEQIYLTTANNVSFTPADSSWNVSNVHDAIEYLRQ